MGESISVTESSDRMDAWTVITVSYNSADKLRECWSATPVPSHARWIVVDNASQDDSVAVARELGADVIELPKNVGFGAANNAALAETSTEFVLFANPDVTVKWGDLPALGTLATETNCLVAPQLVFPNGETQQNSRGLPYLTDKLAHRNVKLPGSRLADYMRLDLTEPTYVAWVIGAAVGGLTEHFRRLGGWNDSYFIYYEDHEIGLRAWEQGLGVVVDPSHRWMHSWARATTGANYTAWRHEFRSAWTFYRRYPWLLTRLASPPDSEGITRLRSLLWKPVG